MVGEEDLEGVKERGLLLPLGVIILVAAAIRLSIEFSTKMMPGLMAAYYPVQARAVLETGKLGLPDLPFVFYLEAGLAKLFSILNLCDLSSCIMTSSKLVDGLVYPLIAVPFFFLSRSLIQKGRRWLLLVAPALAALSISAFIMMADFQKNAIGLLWASFYICFLYRAIRGREKRDYLWAGVFLILTSITHLGGLGFVVAFSGAFLFFALHFERERRGRLLKIVVGFVLLIVLGMVLLHFFDPVRGRRLLGVIALPFRLFKDPMILGIFAGRIPPMPHLLINAVFANVIGILGVILLARKGREIIGAEKSLLLASLATTFLMSSFVLDAEWANRLYLMAYIPAIVVVIFIIRHAATKWGRELFAAVLLLVMIVPIFPMWKIREQMCITEEAYDDLFNLKEVIVNPDKTLVLTRHGLELWSAWVLEVDITHGRDLTEEIYNRYDDFFYLRQESGHGDFGEFGPSSAKGTAFPEVVIPEDAEIVYQDEFYILARPKRGSFRIDFEVPYRD
jgi:hypothetical protein